MTNTDKANVQISEIISNTIQQSMSTSCDLVGKYLTKQRCECRATIHVQTPSGHLPNNARNSYYITTYAEV